MTLWSGAYSDICLIAYLFVFLSSAALNLSSNGIEVVVNGKLFHCSPVQFLGKGGGTRKLKVVLFIPRRFYMDGVRTVDN